MSEGQSKELRARLVSQLEGAGAIRTDAVRGAFLTVRREKFVPAIASERGLEAIYRDDVIVTRRDAKGTAISSSSQPQIMAIMLELLRCEPGHRVLEIGAGTGYNAALLAELVGTGGRVTSVDIDADIARAAKGHLREAGGPGATVRILRADGHAGAPRAAPFDRIIATASVPRIPRGWHGQLSPGGILVAPVGLGNQLNRQVVAAFRPDGSGFRSERIVPGGFMALRGGEPEGMTPSAAYVQTGWVVDGESSTASVEGEVVRSMTEPARRRLMGVLAEKPRRMGVRTSEPMSLAHLTPLSPAPPVQWTRRREYLSGVATADGRSLAGVGIDSEGKPVALASGTDQAAAKLFKYIERAEKYWAAGSDLTLVARETNDFRIECTWS